MIICEQYEQNRHYTRANIASNIKSGLSTLIILLLSIVLIASCLQATKTQFRVIKRSFLLY